MAVTDILAAWPTRKRSSRSARPIRREKTETKENNMAGETREGATYSVTEIVGTSPDGVDQAIRNGIATASGTLRNLDWFEVTEIRGYIGGGGAPGYFQVAMKLGFRYEG
jgi:flavin-binding protein dodecin